MMRKRCYIAEWVVCMLLLTTCFSACCSIDDDLSDCPPEPDPPTPPTEQDYKLNYELRLVTNMTTELETQLTTITEVKVADALRTHLENIFSDFAHDIDLSFYDTEGALNCLYHKRDIIDASQTSYTLTLPMRQYMHLAVANIAENNVVGLKDEQQSNTSMLLQAEGKILEPHNTGLFTARQSMEVLSDVSQTFNVRLFMANSAVALVLNPKGHNYTDMKVYATGFASQFNIKDSVYVYPAENPLISATKVETGNDLLCYCSVNFPSRDAAAASSAKRAEAGPALWQLKVYLTKSDGKVTETVLDIEEPLKAGDLRIIKGELDDDGAVRPYNSTVGVSVTLDWNDAGHHDIDL